VAELRGYRVGRDAMLVSGPEAVTYLQGQLSQDVAALEVGGSTWSWLLQPAGKVDALVRVTRTGPEALLVDVDEGYGELVVNRLTRFKLRTKAAISPLRTSVLMLRGAGATAEADAAGPEAGVGRAVPPEAVPDEAELPDDLPMAARAAPLWAGEEAADILLYGRRFFSPQPYEHDAEAWAVARIAAGIPAMGTELTEKTIPAETGLVPMTVSFTKGCYTGQELVARIDSRGGNVPRHLRRLRSERVLPVGTELVAGDKTVGTVTSSAESADLGPVALAYVGRAVEPGVTVDAGGTSVEVLAGPFSR
jgi:folate-binding protein YgfZ